MAFMEALARRYPTQKVHIIWDNLNTHHGPAWDDFNGRHVGRFIFHYTPIHASWCNQVELWFSVLARRVLRRASFRDAEDLEQRVLNFIARWNLREACAFAWTFKGYLGREQYGVSILWHNGRWQRLPVIGSLVEVVEGLRRDFAELLSPF